MNALTRVNIVKARKWLQEYDRGEERNEDITARIRVNAQQRDWGAQRDWHRGGSVNVKRKGVHVRQ